MHSPIPAGECWGKLTPRRGEARRARIIGRFRIVASRLFAEGDPRRAEVMEIMAVLGHKTPKMAMFYCEQARQCRMNQNAVAKWNAALEKKASKPRKILRAVE